MNVGQRDARLFQCLLGDSVELPATEIARSVVRDCRAYAGGRLSDDCAVVVIKKLR